ncbi:MAG: hypothetical protein ABR568_09925 [Pyrinomonadaceae bacterium]
MVRTLIVTTRPRLFLLAIFFLLLLGLAFVMAQRRESGGPQQRPRRVSRAGSIITVKARGDLQAALNAAQPGDTILLEAGATFLGPFVLPYKAGTNTDADYITMRTSTPDSLLPAAGERITPSHANLLPKLVTPGRGDTALKTEPGAHHYRLLGIEVGLETPTAFAYDLVTLGDGSMAQDKLDKVPHHLILDRCYIHGNAQQDLKRGVALNSAHTEIINSYISDFHVKGQEAQAIGGWNGPGPYKIVNNYLEGAGTNLFIGGAVGGLSASGLVPADIEIRRNHLRKPMEWRAAGWTVKNLLELKNARRVVIDGNLFENNWVNAQSGTAIVFTPRPNDSGPAAVVEDVEFTNNIVRNSASGMTLLGADYLYGPDPKGNRLRRVRISNNLFTGIDGVAWGGGHGYFLLLSEATDSVTVEHNTVMQSGGVVMTNGAAHTSFVFRYNIAPHNSYGFSGDSIGMGNQSLAHYYPLAVFVGNVLFGAGPPPDGPLYEPAKWYPAGTYFPRTIAEVGFVDAAAGNYRLGDKSAYKRAGAGGKSLGCDFTVLQAAMKGP